jgi:hypothetical protein
VTSWRVSLLWEQVVIEVPVLSETMKILVSFLFLFFLPMASWFQRFRRVVPFIMLMFNLRLTPSYHNLQLEWTVAQDLVCVMWQWRFSAPHFLTLHINGTEKTLGGLNRFYIEVNLDTVPVEVKTKARRRNGTLLVKYLTKCNPTNYWRRLVWDPSPWK